MSAVQNPLMTDSAMRRMLGRFEWLLGSASFGIAIAEEDAESGSETDPAREFSQGKEQCACTRPDDHSYGRDLFLVH